MDVQRFTTYPKGVFGGKKMGVEKYLTQRSEQKDRLHQDLLNLIKSEGK